MHLIATKQPLKAMPWKKVHWYGKMSMSQSQVNKLATKRGLIPFSFQKYTYIHKKKETARACPVCSGPTDVECFFCCFNFIVFFTFSASSNFSFVQREKEECHNKEKRSRHSPAFLARNSRLFFFSTRNSFLL